MRRRVDVAGQRVRIGGFQFRHLPPVENLLRQFVALLGQFVEDARAGRPLPGLGLGAARQSKLAEQNVAHLLRRTDIDGFAGELVDLGFEARYQSAKGDLPANQGFGFDISPTPKIDLGGFNYLFTVNVRF